MPDTGWIIAQSAVNDSSEGARAWVNPGRVTADDASNSSALVSSSAESNWIRSSHNFEQLLPINSVIVGLEVRIQVSGHAGTTERVIEVKLHNGTVFIGTTKTPNTTIPDSATNLDFGGAEDTWDATLNLIQIGFCTNPVQVGFRVDSTDASDQTVSADAIWMKLHFLEQNNRPRGDPRVTGQTSGPVPPGDRGDFI